MKVDVIEDLGDRVYCDYCNKDYTDSKESGGIIFGSKAICPECAPEALNRIRGYNEEHFIKAYCPEKMSFHQFVVDYRGDNNKVKFITLDKGESLSKVFKKKGGGKNGRPS